MRESGIRPVAALWVLSALPMAAFANEGSIDRTVKADPKGEVVISNVSGAVDVQGWDRNEVQVTGTSRRRCRERGRGVERHPNRHQGDTAARQLK